MKRLLSYLLAAVACVAMFGCAHPITMNPDLEAIKTPASGRIDKKVGYHLPDSLRALEVTTPGGGGDKVRYFPYRDIEPGFYKALSETFTTVTKVQNAKDWPAVQSGGTSILITPQISTTSSSESAFTWPPTLFTVTLDCAITKGDGTAVQNVKVVGEGQASFDEFKANFSLSAVRATNDALAKLIKALSEMTDL